MSLWERLTSFLVNRIPGGGPARPTLLGATVGERQGMSG